MITLRELQETFTVRYNDQEILHNVLKYYMQPPPILILTLKVRTVQAVL